MQVAIIGAGPRGLTVAERLLNLTDSQLSINIQLFDNYAIGGRVWDPFLPQNENFLMNTIVEQITLFSDDSIVNGGTPIAGPNLYQWCQSHAQDFLAQHPEFPNAYHDILNNIDANQFVPRGLFGVYAAWFYEWLQKYNKLANNHTLEFTQQSIQDISQLANKYQLTLNDGSSFLADQVVMALGHADNELTAEELKFQDYAHQYHLSYMPPAHPAEVELQHFSAQDTVLLRGLGLSFFDYMAALTEGYDGQFIRQVDNTLRYIPSGKEPKIIAGSRSGFPPHARGENQKTTSELYQPQFFTLPALDALKAANHGQLAYHDFKSLLIKELTYKHLLNILNSDQNNLAYAQSEQLKQALLTSPDLLQTSQSFGLIDTPFDIETIMHPEKHLADNVDYQAFIIDYLNDDILDARQGNKVAPFAGSFDTLRDMRDLIRLLVEKHYFSDEDYETFLEDFNAINVRLSVGPPLYRIEQLKALIEADIITIMAPEISISTENGKFVMRDKRGHSAFGNVLVEARLGAIHLQLAKNPLIQNLRQKGWLVSPTYTRNDQSTYTLDVANIDLRTFEILNAHGQVQPNIYLYGIPVEGVKWFMTVIPRPGVNTIILREGAWIAQHILSQT